MSTKYAQVEEVPGRCSGFKTRFFNAYLKEKSE